MVLDVNIIEYVHDVLNVVVVLYVFIKNNDICALTVMAPVYVFIKNNDVCVLTVMAVKLKMYIVMTVIMNTEGITLLDI